MTAPCDRCRYGRAVFMGDGDELMQACVYVLRTGTPRPCPPGAGCTVFEPEEDPWEREIEKGERHDDQ